MIEAELKAALLPAQAKALPDALRALGFTEAGTVQETDLYLNGNDRDFRRTDEALRLRTVQTLPEGGAQTLITYKGPKIDAQSSSRLELETSVEDFETMKKLLLSLGYRAALTVKKTRRSFTRGAQTVCLDDVDGLGDYMELEELVPDEAARSAAAASLLSLLDTLGVERGALTRRSYLELLMAAAME